MPQNEKVLVVDFGGQYNQLVARRVRECNVYCEIVSYRVGLDAIRAQNPKGIIFTGGPNSVYVDGAPTIDPAIFDLGIPGTVFATASRARSNCSAVMSARRRSVNTAKRLFTSIPSPRSLRTSARRPFAG